MTYNVENLFDTQDDPQKSDETFLPYEKKESKEHIQKCNRIDKKSWREECLFLNWSDEAVHQKMSQLARVIQSVSGSGPDILVLQEVENVQVLKLWVQKYLQTSNYQTIVLLEGDDLRGIDVAVVSRFPLSRKPTLHPIPFTKMNQQIKYDTRGILEVHLQAEDREITVYANHFPAPFHPHTFREQAFDYLRSLQKANSNPYQIAAGDFNVPASENQKVHMLENHVLPSWEALHLQCHGCKGTQYYPPEKSWSFLDMILISKEASWKVVPDSIQVVQKHWMLNEDQTPRSFQVRTGNGVSDHLPLYAEIEFL
ncbi:MAG: endonuclease/exonuclease/phosphatase family protein [Bdellovibrionales bacterium]|nr:endonuclease/exonuclease/phosphatase family protein [Bdellovibrionales bacterium]